ncbi:hypothetical protein L2E82_15857 [Cichorium intybus]|uniref:Uncharacterized protein n=1 Tax=Cichorium intybus TaxID=13427 RepID=A0ACB9F4W1_CICIN|nr:hypothetical protein L2E82_15857 [Cichorium intybus]
MKLKKLSKIPENSERIGTFATMMIEMLPQDLPFTIFVPSKLAYIFKNKAESKLKSVADRHWSDGALEAMEDALMALEFIENVQDMMMSKMYKLFGYQQQLVPGMRPGGGPMPNFFMPMVQQGQEGQRPGGRRATSPSQQNQQPVPLMQQQVYHQLPWEALSQKRTDSTIFGP